MTKDIKVKYDFGLRLLEYEGPAELLDSVLERISKSSLAEIETSDAAKPLASHPKESAEGKAVKPTIKPAGKPKKKTTGKKPKFNADLNLLKLDDFYDGHILKNNTECIVAFLKFLSEEVNPTEITVNEIFTCFDQLKTKLKTPGVKKALDNAKNLSHVIDYDRGYTNIKLTTKGSNLYHHDILKRDGEAS